MSSRLFKSPFYTSERNIGQRSMAQDYMAGVLVRITIAMMKNHDQSNMERKGFICLTFPHLSSSLKEVRTRIQTGHQPGGRSLNFIVGYSNS